MSDILNLDLASLGIVAFRTVVVYAALLFGLRADAPDEPAAVAATGARFVRCDLPLGVPVDVIAGPAQLPAAVAGPRPSPAAGYRSPGRAARSPTGWTTAPGASCRSARCAVVPAAAADDAVG